MEQCPTIALSVVGETVEMCTTVKFLTDKRTIAAGEMGADMLVQVLIHLSARFTSACEWCHNSIRQHTPAYVRIRPHTSAYVSIRQHTSAYVSGARAPARYLSAGVGGCPSAYVSIR